MKDKKMADSKIDFSFENLHFSCAGDNDWVEKQLNNVLNRIPALLAIQKQGENVVEEVIEVKAEDVNEVSEKKQERVVKPGKASKVLTRTRKPRVIEAGEKTADSVSSPADQSVKTPKIKVEKIKRQKKEIKIKVPGTPKSSESSETKADADPVAVAGQEVAKTGRKKQNDDKPVTKVSRKKAARVKTDAQPLESPLLRYLTEKKVLNNQVRKFLATAVFLSRNNNLTRLSTPMISRLLKSLGIEKLQNASDCLNKNEKKGYCIKEGKEFIITENGFLSIE